MLCVVGDCLLDLITSRSWRAGAKLVHHDLGQAPPLCDLEHENRFSDDLENHSLRDLESRPSHDLEHENQPSDDLKSRIHDLGRRPSDDLENQSLRDVENRPLNDSESRPLRELDRRSSDDVESDGHVLALQDLITITAASAGNLLFLLFFLSLFLSLSLSLSPHLSFCLC